VIVQTRYSSGKKICQKRSILSGVHASTKSLHSRKSQFDGDLAQACLFSDNDRPQKADENLQLTDKIVSSM